VKSFCGRDSDSNESIAKDNIEVNLSDHRLTIKEETKKGGGDQREKYYRSERSHGSFVKTLELRRTFIRIRSRPASKIEFWRTVPKTEEAKAKEVKVKVD
jgi:HSP20 family protein